MSFIYTPPATKGDVVQTNIHLMVDIETLGKKPGAPVVSIGAVLFDPRKQDDVSFLEERAFLRRVDIEDAINCGAVDGETIKWWFSQEDAAIKALVTGEALSLKHALEDFRQYAVHRWPKGDDKFFNGHCQYPQACVVWANSPDFDCKILEYACREVGEVFPFQFFQYRCLRTLKDLAWPNGPDSVPKFAAGVKHDARADAVNQALVVQAGYKALGLSTQDVQYSTF